MCYFVLPDNIIDPAFYILLYLIVSCYPKTSTNVMSLFADLFLSQCLSDGGLLSFCRRAVKDQIFADAKKSALEVVKTLLDKDASKLAKYLEEIVVRTMENMFK